jgi:hypothetical protein
VLNDGARVQQRLEVESDFVGGGRRPHVFLHFKPKGAAARDNEAGPPRFFSLKPPWLRSDGRCCR